MTSKNLLRDTDTYGTLAWVRRNSGRLTRRERGSQTFALARARAVGRLRTGDVLPGFDSVDQAERALAGIQAPDTPTVRAAAALIEDQEPSALVQHSWRTYLFARLFALRDGVAPDDEVLALASLLHDLGLARSRDPGRECFAHDGAEQALEFLTGEGLEPERRDRVAEAICLHLRVEVPITLGHEAHLMHAGTALDVAGARLAEMPPEAIRIVLERHPREALVDFLVQALEEERRRNPRTRIAHWMRLGFGRLITANALPRVGAVPRTDGGARPR